MALRTWIGSRTGVRVVRGRQGATMVCLALGFAILGAAPASAAAALPGRPAAPSTALAQDNQGGQSIQATTYRVETAEGTLTYGWRPLTGAVPSALRPLSASGCSEDVCIAITGDSNYVKDWNTTAYWSGGYICTHSFWWLNDHLIRTGNGACGGAGAFFSDWQVKKAFPYPSLACNSWQIIPGKPCETIHK